MALSLGKAKSLFFTCADLTIRKKNMHKMVELFEPEIKKSGFLSEWSLFAGEGEGPEVLATMFMEEMRSRDDERRLAFTRLLAFMKIRSWRVFLEEVGTLLEPEELQRFQKPGAKELYERFRLLCCLQVEDYWKEFFAQKQNEATELLEAIDKIPTALLTAKIHAIVQAEVAAQTDAALQKTVVILKDEMKKFLDERGEGEEWKH